MKRIMLFLFSVALLSSCVKEGDPGPMGPEGPKGDAGPGAIVYDFSLTFGPDQTYQGYEGMMDDFIETDVAMVYIRNEYGWVPLPYYWVGEGDYIDLNIYPEITDEGKIWINTIRADGEEGSPWAEPVTIDFRAVLIMSEMIVYKSNQIPPYEILKTQYNLPE